MIKYFQKDKGGFEKIMKKPIAVLFVSLFVISAFTLTSCDPKDDGSTAAAVEAASKMTLKELEDASKAEMEASDDTFKVVGLTSTLTRALQKFAEKYDWLTFGENTYVNTSYKDYALLTALEQADDTYFADYALIQDARSLSDYLEAGITLNYVPSDADDLKLPEKMRYPLAGIHFNKIFYTRKGLDVNFYNIWQVAGSPDDPDHLDNLSFQTPVTEQINMSFILSFYEPANAALIEEAYESYYGKKWVNTEKDSKGNLIYSSCADQFAKTLIANVSVWHSSDGTTMKETQFKEVPVAGQDPFVYYGAYAKMKDAAGNTFNEWNGEAIDPVTAMTTVNWELDVEGFNGFMYVMYSQIIKNAKHPYTACLYARALLTPDMYQHVCYNETTPNKAGEAANMYGYYYPCDSDTVGVNDNDWSKQEWIDCSINENYDFLKTIKGAQVNELLAAVASNKKA